MSIQLIQVSQFLSSSSRDVPTQTLPSGELPECCEQVFFIHWVFLNHMWVNGRLCLFKKEKKERGLQYSKSWVRMISHRKPPTDSNAHSMDLKRAKSRDLPLIQEFSVHLCCQKFEEYSHFLHVLSIATSIFLNSLSL